MDNNNKGTGKPFTILTYGMHSLEEEEEEKIK